VTALFFATPGSAKGLFDTEPLLSEAQNLARAERMLRLSAEPLQNSANRCKSVSKKR